MAPFLPWPLFTLYGLAEDDTDQCDDGDYRDNDDQAGDDDDDQAGDDDDNAAENFVRV